MIISPPLMKVVVDEKLYSYNYVTVVVIESDGR